MSEALIKKLCSIPLDDIEDLFVTSGCIAEFTYKGSDFEIKAYRKIYFVCLDGIEVIRGEGQHPDLIEFVGKLEINYKAAIERKNTRIKREALAKLWELLGE